MLWLLLLGSALAEPHCQGPDDVLLRTEDGAEAWLHRHPAEGPPVLVVHGVSSNHRCWDLSPSRSIATPLNDAGMDVWFLDLRGHGCAETFQNGQRQSPDRNFDDYGNWDVPAAVAHIQHSTGFSRVAYIGHSMGGHVAAAYTARHGEQDLSALVVVGSPVGFQDLETRFRLSQAGAFLAASLPALPSPWAARQAARVSHLPFNLDSLFYTEGSLSPEARAEMYRTVVSPLSRGELLHYRQVLKAGELVSSEGDVDYAEALASLSLPLLVVGGSGDKIAPAHRVKEYYSRAGSSDKTWILAGVDDGFSHDYGHLDLTLGDHAQEEIHKPIAAWLHARLLDAAEPSPEPEATESPVEE